MFREAWRLERDFYYDPNMGGVDWKAIGERYGQLVPYAAHRADLNYILGELIGELSTSHTYVGGGEFPQVARVGTGLLVVTYRAMQAAYAAAVKTGVDPGIWPQFIAVVSGVLLLVLDLPLGLVVLSILPFVILLPD